MCDCNSSYNEFSPMTIGGPSGDYFLRCEVPSAEWVEYRILAIAAGDAGPVTIITSGKGAPKTLQWDGSVTLSDQSFYHNVVYRMGSTLTPPIIPTWIRVLDHQDKMYVRIDCPANTSAYITVQFRAKILNRIPGPATTVHPNQEHLVHKERSRRIEQAVLGREGEIEEYGERPARGGTVRSLQTGRGIDPTNGR